MAEVAAVSIPYNRRRLALLLALHGVLCILALVGSLLSAGGTVYLALAKSWFSLLGLFLAGTVGFTVPYFLGLATTLWRGLLYNDPAIVINKGGVIDNASGYMVGQIAWDEIERMHPWTMDFQLLQNRFFKMPTIARHPGFVIVFKDKAYLKRLTHTKSFWIKVDSVTGYGLWLFVPGGYLAVTPDELIRLINRFYIAEVGGAA